MKKNNFPTKSQFLVMIIIVFALLGLLMINSGQVSAENETVSQIDAAQTSVTQAETASAEESLFSNYSSSAMPSLFKVGAALAVVILAIYLGLFILKKMMGKKYSGNKKNNVLELLETTYIGPKKSVSLIRVGSKSVLVSSTESQVSMLTEMDSDETKEILREMDVEIEPDVFQNMLTSASDKIKAFTKTDRLKSILDVQTTQKVEV